MTPAIASLVYGFVIVGLFWLDRDQNARTSVALWIPVIWLSLACSRSLGAWLDVGATVNSAEQALDGSPVDRLVYTGLLLIGLAVLVSRGKRIGQLLWANGPILLFFMYCGGSLLWSDYAEVGFKRWIKALSDLVMVLTVVSDREPLNALKRLLARVSYVLIPLSILFIKYYPNIGVQYGPWGGKAGYAGVTTNKNTLGAICLCFGLATSWRFLNDYKNQELPGRTRRLIAHVVFLAMVIWLFNIINAMTSLSSFLMATALLVAMNSRVVARRPAIIHLLMVVMIGAAISVVFLGASPGVLQTIGRDPTLTDRTEVWGVLLSLVRHPLLGTGFETFWLGPRLETIWNRYWWHPNEAHNGYLEIYLNLGWVGISLLAVVIATGYRAVFNAWRKNKPAGNLRVAYFFIAMVFNFTEAAFFRMLAPVWIFLLLAMIGIPAITTRKARSLQNSDVSSCEEEALTFSRAVPEGV